MPGAVEEAVAGDVAGLLVFRERIERLGLVGPLLGAVVAADDGVAVARLVAGFGLQDRPVCGAGTVAGRLSAGILVERGERPALGVREGPAFCGWVRLCGGRRA